MRGPLSFGLSYRSKVRVDLDGTFDATAIGPTSTSAATQTDFPDMLQFGIRYEIISAFAMEFDIERTGWSSLDVISVSHSSPDPPEPFAETYNWRDTTTYRVGATYQVLSDLSLRFGYAYDITPQKEGNFSARIPDNNRDSFHAGFAIDRGRWILEGGYMFVRIHDRSINSRKTFPDIDPSGDLIFDPNGTAAYNGKYTSFGNLFGLGFAWRF